MRQVSGRGLKTLIQWEGFENKPYKDVVGKWTIGIGHLLTPEELASGTLTIDGVDYSWSGGIPNEAVYALKQQDLRKFYTAINNKLPADLSQNQYDAIMLFVFNVGVSAFLGSTLYKKLMDGLYDEIPAELKKWTKGTVKDKNTGQKVKVVIKGLVNRRNAEIELWNTPY
jgi:lysozyme